MHIGETSLQPALKGRMHGRRGAMLLQPAGADVMVERENIENTR